MKINAPTADETARALLAMGNDVALAFEAVRLVHLQIEALSARHGVSLPSTPASPF
jgi:hypothetical protein